MTSKSMRNLWILNHYAVAPDEPGGTRHYSLACHLQQTGWNVSILAASTDFSGARQKLSRGEKFRLVNLLGIYFLLIRAPVYKGNGVARLFNMFAYFVRALTLNGTAGLPRPDIILGSSVHPLAALAAALLAKRYNVPFIFEVRDLWPETLIAMKRLRKHSLMAIGLRALEKWLYRKADHIITVLPKAREYIVPFGIPDSKITWLPNGVELLGNPSSKVEKSQVKFNLMYFGSHGQANGLDCLLRAMAYLLNDSSLSHVRLKMYGNGPLKPSLICLAKTLGLSNVEFFDAVSKLDIPILAKNADAFVITVLDLPDLYRFGISMNKIYDYLAAARPILIASNAANNPIQEAGAGITVRPGCPESIAQGIADLVNMSPEQRVWMGEAGRAYVEKYHDYRVLALKLSDLLFDTLRARLKNE